MERDRLTAEGDDFALFEQLMAGEVLLPTQAAGPCVWSPEKRLAAAVLRDALLEVRKADDRPRSQARAAEDLAWIHDDHSDWPFSFLRLCVVFGLDPAWVRQTVDGWRNGLPSPDNAPRLARVTPPVPHAA